jgi:hypothetical protein
MATDFLERSDAIEECYEFMLAYAGQGVAEEGAQVRGFLERAATALIGLSQSCADALNQSSPEALEASRRFLAVIDRDAGDSLAAIEMVLAQPVIGSQVIDNLNASIHLRALLTDIFLFSEVVNSGAVAASKSQGRNR